MIKSNAKSLLDNTAMLYKQTASSMHDVCLDQMSFKCKIGENCSNILCILRRKSLVSTDTVCNNFVRHS